MRKKLPISNYTNIQNISSWHKYSMVQRVVQRGAALPCTNAPSS
jgi:hypothetical protein